MLNKDIICNSEGKKPIKFCERNIFVILEGKYGEDCI
jgi:hypothetical protein